MRSLRLNFILLALLAISAYGNYYQWRASRDRPAQTRFVPVTTATPAAQPAQVIQARYTAKDSTRHAMAAEPVRTRKTEEKQAAVGSGYLDSVVKALDVSVKRIDEVERINASLVLENVRLKQSPQNPRKLEYRDKWLHLTYDADSNQLDSLGYNVELARIRYWSRAWLLAQKRYYNDVYSADPRVTINAVRRFTIPEPRPKKFGVGIQAGYGFRIDPANPLEWQTAAPYLGLGISYNLIRF